MKCYMPKKTLHTQALVQRIWRVSGWRDIRSCVIIYPIPAVRSLLETHAGMTNYHTGGG